MSEEEQIQGNKEGVEDTTAEEQIQVADRLIGDIQASVEELKTKIAETKAAAEEKEKEKTGIKLEEHLTLIDGAKKIQQALDSAENEIASIKAMARPDDPIINKSLDELEGKISELKMQQQRIDEDIANKVGDPAVLGALQKEANGENARKEISAALEVFNPQIDQLAQDIDKIINEKDGWRRSMEGEDKIISQGRRQLEEIFKSGKKTIDNGSDFKNVLDGILDGNKDPKEIEAKLLEAKKSLGFFKGKEKKAIGTILEEIKRFPELRDYIKAYDNKIIWKNKFDEININPDEFADRFKQIILSSWEVQARINKMPEKSRDDSDIPSSLRYRLNDHIKNLADWKRQEAGKEIGKYSDWYSANEEPKNYVLYHLWEEIEKKAGGFDLVNRNPLEIQKQ